MDLKDLKQDKRNYRVHNEKNLSLIKKSIDEVGFGRSIVVDSQNEIIAGNGLVSQVEKGTKIKVVETDGSELVVVKRTDLKTDDEKRCAESLFFDYYRHEGVNIGVVRIFNTYGPNMDKNDGRVVSNFINQALNNQNITIYGNGEQTRSFCFVSDTVEALVRFGFVNETGPLNIGNPSEFTMKELADIVIEKINSKSHIIYMPLPKDDPTRRKPDITKAKKILSWEPKVELSDGLDKTILYFRERT